MTAYVVAEASELGPGDRLVVELGGKDVGVFNRDGEYFALLNWCAHQGGPTCEGRLDGTTTARYDRETLTTQVEWVREGEILCCPWHGWEYDLETGACLSSPGRRLPTYPAWVEDGEVVVELD